MEVPIVLKPGWNFLSLPGAPTFDAIDKLSVYPMFQYERNRRICSRVQTLSEAVPYWIYAKTADTLVLPLLRSHRKPSLARSGWNVVAVTDELALPGGYSAWQWNGRRFVLLESPTVLRPGGAYWIKAVK